MLETLTVVTVASVSVATVYRGAGLIGHVVDQPRPRRRGGRDRAEVRPDERFDRRRIEVADGDDGHEIGPIPVGVELLQAIGGERPDDLGLSDRQALGVAGVLEQDGKLRVEHPRAGAEAHPPLLEDDAALFLDLLRIERDGVRPVFQMSSDRSMTAALSVGICSW